MPIFKGAGVAIVTPMKENGEVHFEKLNELIETQIAAGTDAIIIAGTTGESATLSMEEHHEVIRAAVEYTKHRIPVIAGTGSNDTPTAIQLTKEAEELGADAALLVTPYYNKATQKGLLQHYGRIADETSLPLILYNVPGRTGTNIAAETMAELFRTKSNIVGLKDATGNFTQASKTMALTDGKLELYSGEDAIILPLLAIGAIGVISVWSNVAPKDVHDLVTLWLSGEEEKAREIQFKGLDLVDALFCEVSPGPVKEAMNLMGMNVGPLRSPLCGMEDKNREYLKKTMKEYGLL
ncbi:MAG: 4-hydroxy-tetrahydrodipicolinate synthase [Lachnospiraceae bacterium]|nr:4-hydroxy-tetrahydrodipicolinate synthase [Lachnospiraceae bacterium]